MKKQRKMTKTVKRKASFLGFDFRFLEFKIKINKLIFHAKESKPTMKIKASTRKVTKKTNAVSDSDDLLTAAVTKKNC